MCSLTPEIIALAALLGRTPSSIGSRLGNLASFDPHLKLSGIGRFKGYRSQMDSFGLSYT
jgi:putative restriction endonuclease